MRAVIPGKHSGREQRITATIVDNKGLFKDVKYGKNRKNDEGVRIVILVLTNRLARAEEWPVVEQTPKADVQATIARNLPQAFALGRSKELQERRPGPDPSLSFRLDI